jgi:hypothetical protein
MYIIFLRRRESAHQTYPYRIMSSRSDDGEYAEDSEDGTLKVINKNSSKHGGGGSRTSRGRSSDEADPESSPKRVRKATIFFANTQECDFSVQGPSEGLSAAHHSLLLL